MEIKQNPINQEIVRKSNYKNPLGWNLPKIQNKVGKNGIVFKQPNKLPNKIVVLANKILKHRVK